MKEEIYTFIEHIQDEIDNAIKHIEDEEWPMAIAHLEIANEMLNELDRKIENI